MKRVVLTTVLIAILLALGGCAEGETVPQTKQNAIKFSRQGYEALFTIGNLHEIEIVISQEEWDGLLRDMWEYAKTNPRRRPLTGNYRTATFIYKGPAGDAIIEEVGFRTKGHLNRPYPQDSRGNFHKAHFKIKFNKAFDQVAGTPEYEERNQRRFAKQRELELRMNTHSARNAAWDTSQMRELYAYDLMRRAGVNTSRTGSARLWITIGGVKHYFGIYTLIEPVDKSFLTKRYGSGANDGNLYKCLWGDSGPANLAPIDDPNGHEHPFSRDSRIVGVKDWKTGYRPTYDLKTNTANPDHSELLDFVHNINTRSGADLKQYLEANFEVDRFLRYLAMNVLIGKWDDYWADGNNYYLYFNNDGKIEFYPSDYDMSFGEGFALFDTANIGIYDWGNHNRELLELLAPQIPDDMLDQYADFDYPLVEKMFEIDEYRDKYQYYLAEFIKPENKLFVFSEYEKTFNLLYDLYSPYLYNVTGEGQEMSISNIARKYFHDKTRSIINQLGLNEEDYELPAYEPVLVEEPTTRERPAGQYFEGLPFAAVEVRNERYGFSLKHPSDWRDITRTALYEAIAPTQVSGLFISAWDAAWGTTFTDVLTAALREAPVEILDSGDTTLADGTRAAFAEFNATIVGYGMHLYSIGVIRDGRWIVVNMWNIDAVTAFDRASLEEIAHTLQFD